MPSQSRYTIIFVPVVNKSLSERYTVESAFELMKRKQLTCVHNQKTSLCYVLSFYLLYNRYCLLASFDSTAFDRILFFFKGSSNLRF